MKPSDTAEEKRKRIRDEISSLGQRADELERILPNLDPEGTRAAQLQINFYRLHANRLSERIRNISSS